MGNQKLNDYDVENKEENKTFGNGRYSLRNRIRTLDHSIGEKAFYTYHENGPQLTILRLANKKNTITNDQLKSIIKEEAQQTQKKRREKN